MENLNTPAATATREAALFRARRQFSRRARRIDRAAPFLSAAELRAKQATLSLLSRQANRAQDAYEAAAYPLAFPATDAFLAR